MIDPALKTLIETGVLGAVVALLFTATWWIIRTYRSDLKEAIIHAQATEEKRTAAFTELTENMMERAEAMQGRLNEVLERNTEALSVNSHVIQSMAREHANGDKYGRG